MSSKGPDIIRWVIDWMLANDDSITQEMALRCERAARAEWGGDSVGYIAKTCRADSQALLQQAAAAVRAGTPVSEAARKAGVGRSTLYDHLAAIGEAPAADSAAAQEPHRISLGSGGGRFGGGVRRSP